MLSFVLVKIEELRSDLQQFAYWEVILFGASVLFLFIVFRMKKRMKIQKNSVHIQFLDE